MVHGRWQLDAFQWALADQSPCTIFQLLDIVDAEGNHGDPGTPQPGVAGRGGPGP